MRALPVLLVLGALWLTGSACSDRAASGGDCGNSCDAGAVCVEGVCRQLCRSDRDCTEGGLICVGDVCKPGSRPDLPVILGIDADGTRDLDATHVAHRIDRKLTITGTYLEGASVTLAGGSESWGLDICEMAADRLVVALPDGLESGSYLLAVATQAGECSATLPVLQGETGPLPFVSAGNGLVGDGSSGSPLALDTAFLGVRYALAGHDHDSVYLSKTAPVMPNVSTSARDAIVSPAAGQMVFNTTTKEMNYWDGSAWHSMASGFTVQRTEVTLQSGINIHLTTPTWDYALTGVPATTRAILVGVYYLHSGSTDHGYLSFYAHQRGKAAPGPAAASFPNIHYNDYYNSDYYELIVPWDKSLNDDTLRVQVTGSYNSNAVNTYSIYLKGFITAN